MSVGDFHAVSSSIRSILTRPSYDDGSIGPVLVRLAWHASGTFCAKTKTGGSEGATMRFFPESSDGANAGLEKARAFLEPIKIKYPWISYGDLWTLAGCVAIEAMGGPQIPWRPGRVDKTSEADCPPQGRLPDAAQGAKHIRDVFYRMGFNDREIVALIGAHALGQCHKDRSGYVGPWTYTPTRFSNQYFAVLLNEKWSKCVKYAGGPEQYKNESDDLMMLPGDMALLEDAEFKKYVQLYAKDKQVFFNDFAKAFGKLLELGVRQPGKVVFVCPMRQKM